MQNDMRRLYGIELANYYVVRQPEWENPADPANPVPIEEPMQDV